MRLTLHFATAAVLMAASPLAAKPADYATTIADAQRSEDNRKLDADRLPAEVLDFVGVKRGDTIADYQAGSGYYTELLSRSVGPRGRVYAVGTVEFVKPEIWSKLTASHPNVLLLTAPVNALQLAPGSVDVLFTHLVFHDLYLGTNRKGDALPDPAQVLANWFAAVRPGGHVIVADHVALPGDATATARKLHRIDPETVKSAMAQAGFVPDGESSVLRRSDDSHELLVFNPALRGHTDRFLLKFKRP